MSVCGQLLAPHATFCAWVLSSNIQSAKRSFSCDQLQETVVCELAPRTCRVHSLIVTYFDTIRRLAIFCV